MDPALDIQKDSASRIGQRTRKAQGLVRRGIKRGSRDQTELYRAPFQRSNFKWDAIVLAGTGALISTDRHIDRHLPGGNVDIYGIFRMSR